MSRRKELAEMRKRMIEKLRKLGVKWSYITCDGCPARFDCEYAYDPYNTDGDCLAAK